MHVSLVHGDGCRTPNQADEVAVSVRRPVRQDDVGAMLPHRILARTDWEIRVAGSVGARMVACPLTSAWPS
jgi:hypothetical protein